MWHWRHTWCEWIFGQLEEYLRLNKEYLLLVQVEEGRVVVRSGGHVQGCDYAGCVNDVIKILLRRIPHGFLPGSGGRKAWIPITSSTKDLISHGRPFSNKKRRQVLSRFLHISTGFQWDRTKPRRDRLKREERNSRRCVKACLWPHMRHIQGLKEIQKCLRRISLKGWRPMEAKPWNASVIFKARGRSVDKWCIAFCDPQGSKF